MTLLVTVFAASLMGSLHCAGMCGPFCAVAVTGSGRSSLLRHAAYHGGRVVTYALLGAAAGALGGLLDLATALAGLQPVALGLAGGLMIMIGLFEILRLRGWIQRSSTTSRVPSAWSLLTQKCHRFASRQRGVSRALTIGLVTTLLPCGWLYAFLLTAAGAGTALGGALVMAVFWLGTLPVLLSLGVGVRSLALALGPRLPMATALALVAVGAVTISSRSQLSPESLVAVLRQSQGDELAVPDPGEPPPCCRPQSAQQEGPP